MSDGRVQDEERATVLEKEKDNVIDLLWSFLLEISNVVEACSCQFIYLGAFQDLFYITKFKQNRSLKDDLKEQTKKLEILETKVSKSLLCLTSIATLKRSKSISFRSWLNRLIF